MDKIYKGEIIAFNTGNLYSDKGQRISLVILNDDRVMFSDADRNINGITKLRFGSKEAESTYRENVPGYDAHMYNIRTLRGFGMFCYDFNIYSGTYDPEKKYEWKSLVELESVLEKVASSL